MAANISDLVDDLPNSINKSETLQEIQVLLSQSHPRNLGDVVSNVSFNVIFECLVTEDRQQIDACCDVLEKLLLGLEAQALLPQFADDLQQGLSHPDERVKVLCLRQARRVADEFPQLLAQHTDILNELMTTLSDDSLSVAKAAAHTIMALGDDHDAMCYLFQGQGLIVTQQLLDLSDTIRYRLYELVTDISRLSADNLSLCSRSGLLQKLVNEVYKDDVLVQLNAIELLTRLASVQHGLVFMQDLGIMVRLDEMMSNVNSDPMMSFLLPGLLKFFGGVAYLQPKEVCQRHAGFLPLVFSLHENNDPSTRSLAAETLGMIGRTVDGKRLLEQQWSRMLPACKYLGNMLRDPTKELKVKVLGAIENLLTLPVAEQTSDLLTLCESWYNRLASHPMTMLLNLAEQPFLEIRQAMFNVMNAMATQAWAQAEFRDHATFCEFLLDRSTENSKEGKDGKYNIVQTLVNSPTAMDVLGRVYFVKLKEFAREGPYFKPVESAVAMEEDT